MTKWTHKTKGEIEGDLVSENKSMLILRLPDGTEAAFLSSNLTEVKE